MESLEVSLDLGEVFTELGEAGGGDRGVDLTFEVGSEDVSDRSRALEPGLFSKGVEFVFELIGDGNRDFGHTQDFKAQ